MHASTRRNADKSDMYYVWTARVRSLYCNTSRGHYPEILPELRRHGISRRPNRGQTRKIIQIDTLHDQCEIRKKAGHFNWKAGKREGARKAGFSA